VEFVRLRGFAVTARQTSLTRGPLAVSRCAEGAA